MKSQLDMNRPSRRSVRLAGYNYSEQGAYFVTLCSDKKRTVFGSIRNGVPALNTYGSIVDDCWTKIPGHFPFAVLDEFVVMPNHIHAILLLDDAARVGQLGGASPHRLGTVLGSFKSAVTRRVNQFRREHDMSPVQVWQRNYFEHIIRNERELDQIRRYIAENPSHWATDENNIKL